MGEIPCFAGLLDAEGRIAEAPRIFVQRVYDRAAPIRGQRVLVDRLWPRGVAKDSLHLDAWLKDLAPSNELRRWFGHDPARWDEFVRRYRAELAAPERQEALRDLLRRASRSDLTLLYGARDETHNQAVVLKQVLEEMLGRAC